MSWKEKILEVKKKKKKHISRGLLAAPCTQWGEEQVLCSRGQAGKTQILQLQWEPKEKHKGEANFESPRPRTPTCP